LIDRFEEIDPEVTGNDVSIECKDALEFEDSVELSGEFPYPIAPGPVNDLDSPNMDSPVALDSFSEMAEVEKISRTNNVRNDGCISNVTLYLN